MCNGPSHVCFEKHASYLTFVFAHTNVNYLAQTGKALMLRMPQEKVVVTTLEALSKLASKASIILADQVDLLLSYLCSDPRIIVHEISLKCVTKLAKKAIGRIGSEEKAIEIMISILENADKPFRLKALALQALRKLFPFCAVASDAGHLIRLLSVVELSALCPNWSQVQPVFSHLVDLVCYVAKLRPDVLKAADVQMGLGNFSLLGDTDTKVLPGTSDTKEPIYNLDLFTRIALLICDQVALLGCHWNPEDLKQAGANNISKDESMSDGRELRRRCRFLCGLLLQLVQGSFQCGFAIVDCLSGMVEALLRKFQNSNRKQEPASSVLPGKSDQNSEKSSKVPVAISFLLRTICLCIRDCGLVCMPEEECPSRTLRRLTKLVSFSTAVNVSHHVLKDLLALLLKLREYVRSKEAQAIAIKVNHVAESFVEEGDYWSAYKVVMHAACHGLWTNFSSLMECIAQKAQSEGSYFWLKALATVCTSEANIQIECEKWNVEAVEGSHVMSIDTNIKEMAQARMSGRLGEAIAKAVSGLHSAESSLAAAVKLDRTFEFQRWLLSLRITFIRTSGELIGLLGPVCVDFRASDVETIGSLMVDTPLVDDDSMKPLISSIQAVASKSEMLSMQFWKLAAAFDMLRVSCIGIDRGSANMLSLAALGCSFLSFCTIFSLSGQQALGKGNNLSLSMQSLAAFVANDLYQRLDGVGEDGWPELLSLILQIGSAHGSLMIARWDSCASDLDKKSFQFISWAVREVLHLEEDANLRDQELSWVVLARGMHMLKYIVEKWLCFPWKLPKHFLCTRPPVGIEAFVEIMVNTQMVEGKTISKGCLAPLSLCFQICNLDINGGIVLKRLCCAVLLKSAERQNVVNEEFYTGWRLGWCKDKTIWSDSELFLIEELMLNLGKGVSTSKEMMWEQSSEHGKYGEDKRVSPPVVLCDVNEKGQGFASCLLNTSDLKCGLFHISVLAVCLDNEGSCWIVPPLSNGPTLRITPSLSG